MENLTKELDFRSLKSDFDDVCNTVNDGKESVVLVLKSGRKVFIMPESGYDNISRFVISNSTFQLL